jgi:rhamnopyranosyl-N-acetylglucosaminyl-diphospho-decaprenol beta-1,3/1,4-galactofuranosyltransferase
MRDSNRPSQDGRGNERVCALIVTHNRRELLAEAVAAVLGQSRRPDSVLVLDNASNDGSAEMLAERYSEVTVVSLPRNEGGAGGFHHGVEEAVRSGSDYVWLMDDDTIPEPTALEELLKAPNGSLVASKVVWTDGSLHPMNRPLLAWKQLEAMLASSEDKSGLVPIRAATFTSLLLHRSVVEAHGLPRKEFFIWSDDLEYTGRILRHHEGYLATGSVVVHKTPERHTALTSAGERFYFHVRNTVYMLRGDAWDTLEKLGLVRNLAISVAQFLRRERFSPHAMGVVARGLYHGVVPPQDPGGPYVKPR